MGTCNILWYDLSCMYVYVYMHLRMYESIYTISVCVIQWAGKRTCIYVVFAHVCMYTYLHTYTCIYIYIYIYIITGWYIMTGYIVYECGFCTTDSSVLSCCSGLMFCVCSLFSLFTYLQVCRNIHIQRCTYTHHTYMHTIYMYIYTHIYIYIYISNLIIINLVR